MEVNDNLIEVKMAEGKVAKTPKVLVARAVGSCVVVCLYSSFNKIGGMAHVMLAKAHESKIQPSDNSFRYADSGVASLISELEARGVKRLSLEAKIAGGADMFKLAGQDDQAGLGEKTVKMIRQKLKEYKINLVSEQVGGNLGRSIRFDLSTGIVTVKTKL